MPKITKTIDKYRDKIIKILDDTFKNDQIISPNDYLTIKNNHLKKLKNNIKNYDEVFMNKLYDEQFKLSFVFNKTVETRECKTNFNEVSHDEIDIPKDYLKKEKHFQKLFATPQPEQRSPEWYAFRKERITASDIATALDHNPYEAWEEFIVKKCDPSYPFYDNDTVFHGKKYEEVATMIYQEIFNTRVTEFGCIPSPNHNFLGASPDGICSKSTLDYKFCSKLNTMLEIKCPVRRKIITSGEIKGNICPHYYEYQCQVQMQCCELTKCDFWQCDLEEIDYKTYLENTIIPPSTCGTDSSPLELPTYCHQGCILQFLPKDYEPRFENVKFKGRLENDQIKFQGRIIYPPHVKYNHIEYNNWIIETLNNLENTHKDIYEDFYFDKIIYWRLKKCHNVEIVRDDKWFNKYLPILENTWNKVVYYRQNLNLIEPLKIKSDKKREMWKLKTYYKILSKEYTQDKTLFLNDINIVDDADDINIDDVDFID